MTKRYFVSEPRVCILTDAKGEDPDDCSTHAHEDDVMTYNRRIQMKSSRHESEPSIVLVNDDIIDYHCYDMIETLHNPDNEITNITIFYEDGEWEDYTAYIPEKDEAEYDERIEILIEFVSDVLDTAIAKIRGLITKS